MSIDETILTFKDMLAMSFDDNGYTTMEAPDNYHSGSLASWSRANSIKQKEVAICIKIIPLPTLVGKESNIGLEISLACHDFRNISSYYIESSLRAFYKRITKYGWCKDGNKRRTSSYGVPLLSVITIKLKKLEK